MYRLTLCAAFTLLAGCGGSTTNAPVSTPSSQTVIQPGAPGEPSRVVVATPTAVGNRLEPADVQFMQGMIHHHQQAVIMAEWVSDRTQSTSINLMAQRIEASQYDEIQLMRSWLEKHAVDPDDHSHAHKPMPGMLSSIQLEKLKGAHGKTFDRLFLRSMTRHHKGALRMVQSLVDQGGGVEAEIEQFILHVDSDQSIEIERMQQLLRRL